MGRLTRTRRTVATAAVLGLTATLLAGCPDGEVTKRKCSGEPQVCRITVDDGTRERLVEADDFTWDNCQIGDTYPACGSTGYDNPEARNRQRRERDREVPRDAPVNPPRADPDRESRNKQAKEVCVEAVMTPRRSVRIDWGIGTVSATDGKYGQFGPRCRRVQPGTRAWVQVEEDNELDGRKTSLCQVFMPGPGPTGRLMIDYMMRNDGGDCIAEGRVP